MKIKSKIYTLELKNPLEQLRTPYTEGYYFIERFEDSDKIVWMGCETNWIFNKSEKCWHDHNEHPIDMPEYEKLFTNLEFI